jgi:hypothetical protein
MPTKVYAAGTEVASPGTATVTVEGPTACGGVVAVRCDGSITTTFVANPPPKVTVVAPGTNPLPVSMTDAPPAEGPLGGETEVRDTAAMADDALENISTASTARNPLRQDAGSPPRIFILVSPNC